VNGVHVRNGASQGETVELGIILVHGDSMLSLE